jgi:hypothetical protein
MIRPSRTLSGTKESLWLHRLPFIPLPTFSGLGLPPFFAVVFRLSAFVLSQPLFGHSISLLAVLLCTDEWSIELDLYKTLVVIDIMRCIGFYRDVFSFPFYPNLHVHRPRPGPHIEVVLLDLAVYLPTTFLS